MCIVAVYSNKNSFIDDKVIFFSWQKLFIAIIPIIIYTYILKACIRGSRYVSEFLILFSFIASIFTTRLSDDLFL
jgi:hypothetical protein